MSAGNSPRSQWCQPFRWLDTSNADNISCATGLATDPISGDLFVSQPCPAPNGTNNTRIANPDSMMPTASTYASPAMSDGLVFTPDGTLWT